MEASISTKQNQSGVLSNLGDKMNIDQIGHQVSSGLDTVKRRSREATQSLQGYIRQYPMAFVGGAFAVGFLFARFARR